jgi:hypothetical protein
LENLCAPLGAASETAAGHLICEDEAETRVIPIRIVALDLASAVDEVTVLIEGEGYLDQAAEIAFWVGASQESNLWRGVSDLRGGTH